MTVEELIKELQVYQKKYGKGLKVVMAVDPEGNSFSTMKEFQSICGVETQDQMCIGVCLWPWSEGFEEPEDACLAEE